MSNSESVIDYFKNRRFTTRVRDDFTILRSEPYIDEDVQCCRIGFDNIYGDSMLRGMVIHLGYNGKDLFYNSLAIYQSPDGEIGSLVMSYGFDTKGLKVMGWSADQIKVIEETKSFIANYWGIILDLCDEWLQEIGKNNLSLERD
jgi:hypothetical protein